MAVLIGFIFHHMRSTSSRRPTNRSSLSNANFIWWAISSSNSRFLFARWSRSRSNGGKSFSSSCFAISLWPFRLSITTWCAVLLLMNLFKSCCLSKFSSLKSFYGFSNWCSLNGLHVKMSENSLKILDFFVSGKKKCRKIDPCVKMSENGGKNVRKFPRWKYTKMSEKNSEISNSEKLIEISVSSLTSDWNIIFLK